MNICLTLAERSLSSLEAKIARYCSLVPFIEVRLDHLGTAGLPSLPGGRCQYIATCRPLRQGGLFERSECDRLGILEQAARSGFDWIDLEHDAPGDPNLPEAVRVVRSRHEFERFPDNLEQAYLGIAVKPGECRKLAVQVSTTRELVRLLTFMESLPADPPRIVLGMGLAGQPSRYLGALIGNTWTYVAEDSADPAAPGQFSLSDSLQCLGASRLSLHPEVYAVLGNPVAHSLSPLLHNGLFSHYRMDRTYFPFHLDNADAWMDYVRSSRVNFAGFSVTIPFKSRFAGLADRLHTNVPAINTLHREDSLWSGFNTDLPGFLAPLLRRTDLQGKTALVLGNGGVAHTVVSVLQNQGVSVFVMGRNPEKVARFVRLHGCSDLPRSALPFRTDILVNTTPVGQAPEIDASPLLPNELECDLVYDLVYNPERTKLLHLAEERHLETISGIEMFIEQAACQFEIWTGVRPDSALVSELIRKALGPQ